MNMQEIMKQAQRMQKTLVAAKKRIDEKEFEGKSELIKIKINGKKEVISVNILSNENIGLDDFEIMEDMIMLAFNQAIDKVNQEVEEKLGTQASGLGDLM